MRQASRKPGQGIDDFERTRLTDLQKQNQDYQRQLDELQKKTDTIQARTLEKEMNKKEYRPQGYKISRPLTELNPSTGEYMPLNSKLIEYKSRDAQLQALQQQIEQERAEGEHLRAALNEHH